MSGASDMQKGMRDAFNYPDDEEKKKKKKEEEDATSGIASQMLGAAGSGLSDFAKDAASYLGYKKKK